MGRLTLGTSFFISISPSMRERSFCTIQHPSFRPAAAGKTITISL
jgi:hypothetical protein